jgi:hypothetical protein
MSLKVSARLVQTFEILRVYGVLRLSFCEAEFESKTGAATSALPIIRLGKARGFPQGVLLQARVVAEHTAHPIRYAPRVFSREPPSQSIIALEFRIERKSLSRAEWHTYCAICELSYNVFCLPSHEARSTIRLQSHPMEPSNASGEDKAQGEWTTSSLSPIGS